MNLKQRLVLLLSDPEVSESEFRSIKTWLVQGGMIEYLQDVEAIRNTLRSYKGSTGSRSYDAPPSIDHELVLEVDRLLRKEANMTARDALEQLADQTDFQGTLPQRISFADGVRRMGKEIGESHLLHIANRIRNDNMHNLPGLDWPLNRG